MARIKENYEGFLPQDFAGPWFFCHRVKRASDGQ
jgi:hypothetical protein